MFSKPIEMHDAVISSIHVKMEDDRAQTRILVYATIEADLADKLSARSVLFADNGTPKQGFTKIALDTGCQAFRAVFQADPALKQSFELVSGDSTDTYEVERKTDSVFRLKLRLNYHGDPHHAIAYIQAVGTAESSLKIVPLQTEIDDSAKVAAAHREPENAAPKDEVRQSLISHQRKAAKKATTVK